MAAGYSRGTRIASGPICAAVTFREETGLCLQAIVYWSPESQGFRAECAGAIDVHVERHRNALFIAERM
jgi:hypothetical protein